MSMINNALSGTIAAQAALNLTSQNVANVMTPGYTRQGILLTSASSSRTGALAAGDGVNTPSLFRFSDDYKSQQMWNAASNQGQYSVVQPYQTQLEQVMGDDGSTLNTGLDAFFSALNAASVEPSSSPLRQQVISAADALAQRFNSLNQVLSAQRASVQQQRGTLVDQVNSLSAEIAKLNDRISGASATGTSTSSLVDERDNKIDSLAALVGVSVVNQPDGSRSVSLRNGEPLVAGSLAAQMSVQTSASGVQSLAVKFASQTFNVANTHAGGQLGGLGDFETRVLTPLTQSISDMASQISSQVNAQLAAGFTQAGTAGSALFVYNASSVSGMLQITPGVQPKDLGFSSSATLPGDSGNLLKVIDLKNQAISVTSLGSVLMGDAYTQLVSRLGTESQQNQASLTVANTVRTYAQSNWQSTSGVNKDEEAINLVQYQQMYQANMKVISVANQLFDSTLALLP